MIALPVTIISWYLATGIVRCFPLVVGRCCHEAVSISDSFRSIQLTICMAAHGDHDLNGDICCTHTAAADLHPGVLVRSHSCSFILCLFNALDGQHAWLLPWSLPSALQPNGLPTDADFTDDAFLHLACGRRRRLFASRKPQWQRSRLLVLCKRSLFLRCHHLDSRIWRPLPSQ